MIGNNDTFLAPKQEGKVATSKPTLLSQILSGYHDPLDGGAPFKPIDYQYLGAALFSKITPRAFWVELIAIFKAAEIDGLKSLLLHNAQLLLANAIRADVNQEFQFEMMAGLSNLSSALPSQSMVKNFASEISLQIEKANQVKAKVQAVASQSAKGKKPKPYFEDAKALAKDLKKHQLLNLANLKLSHYYNKNWSKEKNVNNPDFPLTELTHEFNKISDMVVTDILSAKSKSDQKERFKYYVDVIKYSLELGDCYTPQAIQGALSRAPIERLKYLSVELKDTFVKLENLTLIMESKNNFAALNRFMLDKLQSDVVVIPPLNLLTRNITFIEDANPDDKAYGKTIKGNETKVMLVGKELCENLANLQVAIANLKPTRWRTNFLERFSVEPELDPEQREAICERASFDVRAKGNPELLINEKPIFSPDLLARLKAAAKIKPSPLPQSGSSVRIEAGTLRKATPKAAPIRMASQYNLKSGADSSSSSRSSSLSKREESPEGRSKENKDKEKKKPLR